MPATSNALDRLDFRVSGPDDDALLNSLRGAASLSQLDAEGDADTGDILAAAQTDYTRLVEALYAQGYYGASVRILIDGREAATIAPLNAPASISRVQVFVDPGRQFRFGTARIGPMAPGDEPVSEFNSGAVALATVVRAAAQGAVTGWREAGYAKAEIAGQSIIARHEKARLDVEVGVAPGRLISFGDVIVTGESRVKAARVRQIAGVPRGKTFSPDVVDLAAQRLRATGTFRSVQLTEAERVASDGSMDIRIDVVDRAPRRFGAGVELSTQEGLTLTGFWLHRNFFGGAERFRVEGEVTQLGSSASGTDYSLSARLEKPAVYGADTLAFAEGALSYEDEPKYIERKASLGLGVSRTFSPQLTGNLGIQLSYSEVTDTYLPKVNGKYPTRELTLFSLPASLTWDLRDDPLDAKAGYFLMVEAEPFVEPGGGISGGRFELDARAYRAFGEDDGLVFAGRVQLGSLAGPDAPDAPPGFLFYSGGGGTVRGQPYQSLDVDYGSTRLGGRSFLGLSAEVRADLTANLGLVAFADAGYVGGESFYDGSGDWHSGAGLGVRYATPVGPIRVDVAGPLSGDTGDGAQIYIGIGQAF